MTINTVARLFFAVLSIRYVNSGECNPDDFQIKDPPFLLPPDKGANIAIKNDEKLDCDLVADFLWEVFRIVDGKLLLVKENVLRYKGMQKHKQNHVDFSPLAAVEDLSGERFAIKVTLFPKDGRAPGTRIVVIQIKPYDLSLTIDGAPEITYTLGGGGLILNGNLTLAANYIPNSTSVQWTCVPPFGGPGTSNTLRWDVSDTNLSPGLIHNCTLNVDMVHKNKERNLSASVLVKILEKPKVPLNPIIDIICIENCDGADADKNTILQYVCIQDCDDAPSWEFDPYDANISQKIEFLKSPNDSVLIPAGTYSPDTVVEVVVRNGLSTANYTINFLPRITEITLECIENCYFRHKPIVLKVTCHRYCDGISYHWEVRPLVHTWNTTYYVYNISNDIITFPPYSFPPEGGATVLVKTLDIIKNLTFNVTDLKPEMLLECFINCHPSIHSKTITLNLTCLSNCFFERSYLERLGQPLTDDEWNNLITYNSTLIEIPARTYAPNQTVNASVSYSYFGTLAETELDIASIPELEIVCLKNCGNTTESNSSNNLEGVILQVKCRPIELCDNLTYEWTLTPPADKAVESFSLLDNGKLMFIQGRTYRKNMDVVASVSATGAVGDSYTIHYKVPTPKIEILCLQNCFPTVNPFIDMIYQAVCLSFCDEVEFEWRISPAKDPFFWHDKVELSYQNITIKIKDLSFKPGDNVELMLVSHPTYSEAFYNVPVGVWPSDFELRCIENCNPSWTHLKVRLRVHCWANCLKLNLIWNFSPEPNNFKWAKGFVLSDDNTSLTINEFTFNDGDKKNFTVKDRNTIQSILLTFQDVRRSILSINCVPRECHKLQSIRDKVVLYVTCSHSCSDITYDWDLNPLPQNFEWDKHIIQGPGSDQLAILPGTFKDKDNINVTVRQGKSIATTILRFRVPEPDFQIVCHTNCNHSNPNFEVYLKIKCYRLCDSVDEYSWNVSDTGILSAATFWDDMAFDPGGSGVRIPERIYKDGDIIMFTAFWGESANTIKIAFVEPRPKLVIQCVVNCLYDPHSETIIKCDCTENCYVAHTKKWFITTSKKKPIYHANNHSVSMPADSYEPYDQVNFTVCLGKSCESFIVVYKMPKSVIKIICLENCGEKWDTYPSLKSKFQVICLQNCKSMMYNWFISPLPKLFNAKNDIELGINNETLTLRKDLYLDTACVQITVTSILTLAIAEYLYCYKQSAPIWKIICIENCGYPDPTRRLILKAHCFHFCKNLTYNWEMTPKLRKFTWKNNIKLSNDNSTLILKENTFQDSETALFIVRHRSYKTDYLVRFARPHPIIALICQPSCNAADPWDKLNITVVCFKHCYNLFYVWSTYPQLPGFLWSLNVTLTNLDRTLTIKEDTYEDGSVVYVTVVTNRSTESTVIVHYYLGKRGLSLKCEKNCEYNPLKPIYFRFGCRRRCRYLDKHLQCETSPPPNFSDGLTYNSTFLVIAAHSFGPNVEVEIRCQAFGENVFYKFKFSVPSITTAATNEKCFITPSYSIGGVTKHEIFCEYILLNTKYHVYQVVPGINSWGMLLDRQPAQPISDVYLAPSLKSEKITIIVARVYEWTIYQIFKLSVTSVPFLYPRSWTSNNLYLIILKYEEYKELIKSRRYSNAMQLAFALDRTLELVPDKIALHYRYHLLELISQKVERIEPIQILSFVEILLLHKVSNPAIIHLCADIVLLTSKRFLPEDGYSLINDAKVNVDLAKNIMTLSGKLIFRTKEVTKELYFQNINSMDESSLPNITDLVSLRHLKDTSYEILQLMRVAKEIIIINTALNKRVSSKNIKVAIIRTNANVNSLIKIKTSDFESFVDLIPSKIWPNSTKSIAFQVANFNPQLFWWDGSLNDQRGSMVFFSATSFPRPKHAKHLFKVHVKLKRKIEYTTFNFTKINYQLWTVKIPINYTLVLDVFGLDVNVTISSFIPNKTYTALYGTHVNLSVNFRHFAKKSPVYIGIISSKKAILQLAAAKCLAWHGDTWQWKHNGCNVSSKQENKDFLTCECNRQSFFTANTIEPVINKTLVEDIVMPSVAIDFRLSLLIVFIILFIILLLLIIAAMKDRKVLRRLKYHRLHDSYTMDQVTYFIIVQTGWWSKSGTTARVAIQLIGRNAMSKVHLLNPKNRPVLQRNCVDHFIMFTKKPLGRLTQIRIWHDSHGKRPHWFCDTIVVQHIPTHKASIFPICRWFSLIYGTGSTYGVFRPKSTSNLKFREKLKESIRTNHSFVSPLTYKKTQSSLHENIVITVIIFLTIMAGSSLLLAGDLSIIYSVLIVVAISCFLSIFLDTLFWRTNRHNTRGIFRDSRKDKGRRNGGYLRKKWRSGLLPLLR